MDIGQDGTKNGQAGGCGHQRARSTSTADREQGCREVKCSRSHGEGSGGCVKVRQDSSCVPQEESHGLAVDYQVGGLADVHRDDSRIETYAGGGKREKLGERWDLIPGLQAVAQAMHEGAEKYGEHNWRGLPASNIANHALRHLHLWVSGDRSEPHLSHAAANLLMLVEMEEAKDDGCQ